MKNPEQNIIEEMRMLIAKSCKYDEIPSTRFQNFQKDLMKFFFNVVELKIDYEKGVILLWNSKPMTKNSLKLYDINESILEKVSYSNLEETLKGCLENGSLQDTFYTNLLFTYNDNSSEDDEVKSA